MPQEENSGKSHPVDRRGLQGPGGVEAFLES